MKRELALRFLQSILPGLTDEGDTANLFRELQFLADYKYNKYEMYHPGRLFLENLSLWLQQFEEDERGIALDFVRKSLIFISRQEFQQLAGILYHDVIKRRQLEIAAILGGYPQHKVRVIRESPEFKKVTRASLYVAMSDGARIDYIRRHNLEISNEQVLPYYETSPAKIKQMLKDLRTELRDPQATFQCLFLIDDFCGSGRTLLREVVISQIGEGYQPPAVPPLWRSRLRFNEEAQEIELLYEREISASEQKALFEMGSGEEFDTAVNSLVEKVKAHDTVLKGALFKAASGDLVKVLGPNSDVFFCPLLATEHALKRLKQLVAGLPEPFDRARIWPGALIDSQVEITSPMTPIGALCEKYYSDDFGDDHTGCVKFGFDYCGLPVILHHNTPNNSIYLLWARRKEDFSPLFVRYERHGREGA